MPHPKTLAQSNPPDAAPHTHDFTLFIAIPPVSKAVPRSRKQIWFRVAFAGAQKTFDRVWMCSKVEGEA
jgi:hypothetical protein